MSNLDQLLSYLLLITVITFIFERILENLLIPLLPASSQTDPESRVLNLRTYITLFLIFALGLGLALSNPKFRLFSAGFGMEAAPLIDSIFTAALMAGGSQPLHSLVDQIRKK
ncbi:MAG: hypothetical protein GX050_10520 [Firmicutes bacterium]|nr:hypothetical protein [Bacillota bacterium]